MPFDSPVRFSFVPANDNYMEIRKKTSVPAIRLLIGLRVFLLYDMRKYKPKTNSCPCLCRFAGADAGGI